MKRHLAASLATILMIAMLAPTTLARERPIIVGTYDFDQASWGLKVRVYADGGFIEEPNRRIEIVEVCVDGNSAAALSAPGPGGGITAYAFTDEPGNDGWDSQGGNRDVFDTCQDWLDDLLKFGMFPITKGGIKIAPEGRHQGRP